MKTLYFVVSAVLLSVMAIYAADYTGSTTGPELDYVHGVTGPIQPQINNVAGYHNYSTSHAAILAGKQPLLGYTPYNATNPNNYINPAGAPVQTVFGRTGTVTAQSGDYTAAQVGAPANTHFQTYSSNDHATPVITNNMTGNTTWWQSVKSTLATYFDTLYHGLTIAGSEITAALGFTPENVANKSTDGTMASNSATLYPSQSAVVTYVGAHAGIGSVPWNNISSAVLKNPMNIQTGEVAGNSTTGFPTDAQVYHWSALYSNWSTSLRANKTTVASIIGATSGGGSNNGDNGYGGVLSGSNYIQNGYWYTGPATSGQTQTFRSYSTGKITSIFLPMSTSICPDSSSGTFSWVNPATNVAASAGAGYCVNASKNSKVDIWTTGSSSYQVVSTTRNLVQSATNPYVFTFTDNFTGSAGNINTANWTVLSGQSLPQLTGSGSVHGNGANESDASYTALTAPANQWAELDGITYNGSYVSTAAGVWVRGITSGFQGYLGQIIGNGSSQVTAWLQRYGGSNPGMVYQSSAISPSNKYSKVKLDVQGTGTSTVLTFTGWNGTSWDTFYTGADTSGGALNSGQPGVRFNSNGGYPTAGPFSTGTP